MILLNRATWKQVYIVLQFHPTLRPFQLRNIPLDKQLYSGSQRKIVRQKNEHVLRDFLNAIHAKIAQCRCHWYYDNSVYLTICSLQLLQKHQSRQKKQLRRVWHTLFFLCYSIRDEIKMYKYHVTLKHHPISHVVTVPINATWQHSRTCASKKIQDRIVSQLLPRL
jgi:hypothetical protein